MEQERVTVQQAAARLGIAESAVWKRARKGDIRSEKVMEEPEKGRDRSTTGGTQEGVRRLWWRRMFGG